MPALKLVLHVRNLHVCLCVTYCITWVDLKVAQARRSNSARLGITAHGGGWAGRNRVDLLEQRVWL